MQITHLFWPSDRKLFRQRSLVRSRLRGLLQALAAMVLVALAVVVGQVGWA